MMNRPNSNSNSSDGGEGEESTSMATASSSSNSNTNSKGKATSIGIGLGDGTEVEAADADGIQNHRNREGEEEESSINSVSNNNDDVVIPYHQPQLATFPLQLMDLIEKESTDDNALTTFDGQKVVEWISSGKKFIIRNTHLMESSVLPKYFNNRSKFMSFVRKLYRWGFRQVEKDDSGMMIFFHKKFTRGDTNKCLAMRSIVKKPAAATIMSLSDPSNRNQPGKAHNAGDVMVSHLLQSNHQATSTYTGSDSINANMLSGMSMGLGLGYGESTFNMSLPRGGGGGESPGHLHLPATYAYGPGMGMQMQPPQSNYLSSRLDLMHQRPVDNMNLNMNFITAPYSNAASAHEAEDEDEGYSAEAMLLLAKRDKND